VKVEILLKVTFIWLISQMINKKGMRNYYIALILNTICKNALMSIYIDFINQIIRPALFAALMPTNQIFSSSIFILIKF